MVKVKTHIPVTTKVTMPLKCYSGRDIGTYAVKILSAKTSNVSTYHAHGVISLCSTPKQSVFSSISDCAPITQQS